MKQLFQKIFKTDSTPAPNQRVITIVSGLPRSGTSMMMKMLEAGGLTVLTDNIREADTDNPKGYYEFERVKKVNKGDQEWLEDAQGKVVKIISELLKYLPLKYQYKVIFINRKMEEILASHKKMLENRGVPDDGVSDEEIGNLFKIHLKKVDEWLKAQPNFSVLYVDYNQMLANPTPYIKEINRFLGNTLDEEKMSYAVDPNLYRNRK
ncbi:MAG: sulfotransferase domain-containing protein [Deltaproteobacteria bacterium]|nr:sulfotransferase domain-containing protein [Deltaproteobacteria bacterium]